MTAGVDASEPFRLGINYWPARTAMRWWTSFDEAETAEDFERIAAAGFDSVRVFLLWEAFQPEPEHVDPEMLERLVTVANVARSAGLHDHADAVHRAHERRRLDPGVGARGCGARCAVPGRVGRARRRAGLRNWYLDDDVVRAQALFARRAAEVLAGHDALWAWDLGNENSNCVVPAHRELARRWLSQMTSAIRAADGLAEVTIGIHMEDLEEDRRLGPHEAAEACDFLTMHGYPIYARWARGGTDEALVPFLARVTRWLGGGADVLFSEFGLPTFRDGDPGVEDAPSGSSPLIEEAEAAEYVRRVLPGLREAGATGAMLWCYSDYHPAIFEHPPLDEAVHERSFGLWRADGSPKPALDVVRSFAGATRLPAPDREPWIDIDAERYWERPEVELPRLYGRFLAMAVEGGVSGAG